ncbi:hypothetical protein TNCV_990221 [Trichonephila clavipes]|nr:hypothetical protein TNCV_990221 [Trichonephila clavipes]
MAHAVEGVGYRIEHSCTHRELARAGSWKNFGQTGAYTKTKLQPITFGSLDTDCSLSSPFHVSPRHPPKVSASATDSPPLFRSLLVKRVSA